MLHIILVNYNSSLDTINCIKSIYESNKYGKCIIEIFDNNSKIDEIEKLKEFINSIKPNEYVLGVKCYYSDINLGFATGNNYWLEKVNQDEYVWFLNNDTLTNENLFEKIFSKLPADDAVLHFDCRTFDDKFHDNGLHFINLYTGRYHTKKKLNSDFAYICGASILLKKTERTPYWDESYFLYFEDADYGYRLQKAGIKYVHLDGCYFKHKISASSDKEKRINYIKLRSQILFMKRYGKCFSLFFAGKLLFLLFKKRDLFCIKKFIAFSYEKATENYI